MPRVVARYDYVDEAGKLIYQVERLEPKGFRQRRPHQDGWVYGLGETRRVPYRLPAVLGAVKEGRWVLLVEGEKDVHSAEGAQRVATTLPGGAGKWKPEYAEYLRGGKVAVIADADGPGRKHALAVACALDGVVEELLVCEPAPPHKDLTEHLDAGLAIKQLVPFDWRAQAASAPAPQVAIRVMSVNELMATPDPQPHDLLLDELVVRGSRVVIGGHSGEGKTSFGLQMLACILRAEQFLNWRGQGNGTRALVLDAEQGRRTVKRRFVEVGLHEFPEKVDLVHVPDGLALDSNAQEVERLEAIFKAGHYDVVLADPLYKLHRGDANDERRAVDLMRCFDRWRQQFNFALVLPMHCRKPQPGQAGRLTIHDLMGSSAYSFGAEVIVGIQRKNKGYAHLYWWKDREGDLGCINERWGLIFDQQHGFRRAPRDVEEAPLREQVRSALERSQPMTVEDLRDETGAKPKSLARALEGIGALHDGERLAKDRRWSLPPSLFQEREVVSDTVIAGPGG